MFRLRSRRRKRSRRKGDTLKRAGKKDIQQVAAQHTSARERWRPKKTKIKYIKSNLMSSSSSARLSIWIEEEGDREKRLFGAGEMSCVLPSPITGDMAAVANESNGRWIHIEIHQAKHRLYSHRNDIGRAREGNLYPHSHLMDLKRVINVNRKRWRIFTSLWCRRVSVYAHTSAK